MGEAVIKEVHEGKSARKGNNEVWAKRCASHEQEGVVPAAADASLLPLSCGERSRGQAAPISCVGWPDLEKHYPCPVALPLNQASDLPTGRSQPIMGPSPLRTQPFLAFCVARLP